MRIISSKDIKEWSQYLVTLRRGWPMSESAHHELIRLNHLIMETSADIHNDNILRHN